MGATWARVMAMQLTNENDDPKTAASHPTKHNRKIILATPCVDDGAHQAQPGQRRRGQVLLVQERQPK
jgi:hypothetical protein